MSGDAPTPAQDPSTEVSDDQQPGVTASESTEAATVDAAPSPEAAASEPAIPAGDNEARLVQLEREHSTLREEHEVLRGQYVRIAADLSLIHI